MSGMDEAFEKFMDDYPWDQSSQRYKEMREAFMAGYNKNVDHNIEIENTNLRNALIRLGSMEAFDVATRHVSEELKMRVAYAQKALEENPT